METVEMYKHDLDAIQSDIRKLRSEGDLAKKQRKIYLDALTSIASGHGNRIAFQTLAQRAIEDAIQP